MESKISRPASVVIAQILMIIVSLVYIFFILLGLFTFLPMAGGFWNRAVMVGMIGLFCAFIGLFLTAFWGMARRRPYGRWLGVVALSWLLFYVISGVVGKIFQIQRYSENTISS